MRTIRVHGDNIVECERVLKFLSNAVTVKQTSAKFVSAAVLEVDTSIVRENGPEDVRFQFFPGFNKSNRKRWQQDVFSALRASGSFLDETPDAIVTLLSDDGSQERVLCALEFCSALQAGNQAWQRSGRAYSTMRAGCPYLYIVDFPKYELDGQRTRKALRFPNAVVPYSYVEFAKNSPSFGAQVFFRSEEYEEGDPRLKGFDRSIFGDRVIGQYFEQLIFEEDSTDVETQMLSNNVKMVEFFASGARKELSFTSDDWDIIHSSSGGFLERVEQRRIKWKKKVASKSGGQHTEAVLALMSKVAVGIGASDLPLAYVPVAGMQSFVSQLTQIDSEVGAQVRSQLDLTKPVLLCAVKGFKPRGDDARPDRGILPMAAMLAGEETQIFTYIYGPMTRSRFGELSTTPRKVMKKSGFWNVFLSLSNVVLIDSPEVNGGPGFSWGVVGSNELKAESLAREKSPNSLEFAAVPTTPNSVHEDDVDAVLHTAFAALPEGRKFEGLCNPPGGDWSGLSLTLNGVESRWLSLPRVSGAVNGKRPDHVVQIMPDGGDDFVLSIESKDRAKDLEPDVGHQLKRYLVYLASHIPSAKRELGKPWGRGYELAELLEDTLVSAAAYIAQGEDEREVFARSKCQILISMQWLDNAWTVKFRNADAPVELYSALKASFAEATLVEGIELEFL